MTRLAFRGALALGLAATCLPGSFAQDALRLVDVGDSTNFAGPFGSLQEHGRSVYLNDFLSTYDLGLWDHAEGASTVSVGGVTDWIFIAASDSGDHWVGEFVNSGIPDASIGLRGDRFGNTLSLLPPAGGIGGTLSRCISGDGSMIGGSYLRPDFNYAPCLWDSQGVPVALGGLPGGDGTGNVRGLSDDGLTAFGYSSDGSGPLLGPFLWTSSSGMQPLDPLAPGLRPVALSGDASTLVGELSGMGQPSQAARLKLPGSVQVLIPNADTSSADFVSRDGSIVVGEVANGAVLGRPSFTGSFVWVDGVGAMALEDVLAGAGIALPSAYDIWRVVDLAPDGDAILFETTSNVGLFPIYVAYLEGLDLPIGTGECGPAVPNSTGVPAEITAHGFGYASSPGFELRATHLPPSSVCMFLASEAAGFSAMPGGSQGNLCLGGSIGRFRGPGQLQFADASGQAALTIDPTMIPQPTMQVSIVSGQTWRFQAWYRDANPNSTSNFTDAVAELFD